jgi:hypothetical protein
LPRKSIFKMFVPVAIGFAASGLPLPPQLTTNRLALTQKVFSLRFIPPHDSTSNLSVL